MTKGAYKPGTPDISYPAIAGPVVLSRNEISLEPETIGIFKEDGVVAGCPGAVLGRMNDLGLHIPQNVIEAIDVFARAQTEAEVVQSDAPLVKMCFAKLIVRRGYIPVRPPMQ
jgi:hypothetical protein